MAIYDYLGNVIGSGGQVTINGGSFIVKSVSHRGTHLDGKLNGYTGAKEAGFTYGENDINFTSDGYVIMRHDGTISINGVNTSISSITYAELMAVDSTIPTLQEWLECMKCIALYPYIDTKRWSGTWSTANLQIAVDIVKSSGIADKCTWLIGTIDEAELILTTFPNARIGWLNLPTSANMTTLLSKKTAQNDLFFDADYTNLTAEHVNNCINNKIPLEVYTIRNNTDFEAAYAVTPYISGFTCNGTTEPNAILMAKYM